jgi:hypothetical protein
MSCESPAIPIIGLPAKLVNGLEQRWLRLLICHLKTIDIRKEEVSVQMDSLLKGRAQAIGSHPDLIQNCTTRPIFLAI